MINTIYIENGVKNHPRTQTILNRFDQARQISIDRYGEVFNRRAQNFRLQKLKPALILAQKKYFTEQNVQTYLYIKYRINLATFTINGE